MFPFTTQEEMMRVVANMAIALIDQALEVRCALHDQGDHRRCDAGSCR